MTLWVSKPNHFIMVNFMFIFVLQNKTKTQISSQADMKKLMAVTESLLPFHQWSATLKVH